MSRQRPFARRHLACPARHIAYIELVGDTARKPVLRTAFQDGLPAPGDVLVVDIRGWGGGVSVDLSLRAPAARQPALDHPLRRATRQRVARRRSRLPRSVTGWRS